MRDIKIGGKYRHFKGSEYIILIIAKDSENLKEIIVYQDINTPSKIWTREKDDFLSEVDNTKYPEVKQKYRFEEI